MKKRVCAFLCMQDEAWIPAVAYLKEEMGFEAVDFIGGGGIVKPLADAAVNFDRSALIRYWESSATVSVKENGACVIAVMAHIGCKGNKVSKAVQDNHLRLAGETLNSFALGVPVIRLLGETDGSFKLV